MAKMTPQDWLAEIDVALEFRKQYAREEAWETLENMYLHDPQSATAIGNNIIFEMGDVLLSSLSVPDPEFIAQATHPSGVDRAPIVEAVDNWLSGQIYLKRAVERANVNNYLRGKAIVKVGYDSEFGWSPYYDVGIQTATGMTFTQFDKKGKRIEFGPTKPGMPWVASVHPSDFVVPWGTIDLYDAPWCAHRVIRATSDIKADPKYKHTYNLSPTISMKSFMESYRKVGNKFLQNLNSSSYALTNQVRFNVLWEIHDRRDGSVKVVTQDYDDFLRDDVDVLQIRGELPFVAEGFVTHPNSFWSTPLAFYLGQLQKTEFDIELQAEKQRRVNTLKFLMDKNMMTQEEADKFLSSGCGAVGQVDPKGKSIREAIVPAPQGSSLNLAVDSENVMRKARSMIGYGDNQMGNFNVNTRRTAREAMFVQQGASGRSMRRLDCVKSLYIDTMKKVNRMVFSFWKVPKYIMVDSKWVNYTGEEIEGEYSYDLSLSSKRQISKAERKVEAIMMLAQFAQIPGANLEALKRYLIDASSDPAFERLLPSGGSSGMQGNMVSGQQGGANTPPDMGAAQ